MSYKWKPSKSQRRAFAERMNNDPEYASDYYARKEARKAKNRAGSRFDYDSAGGFYVPTLEQYNAAMRFVGRGDLTWDQLDACSQVIGGYTCQERTHHDYIHIVNELRRLIDHL